MDFSNHLQGGECVTENTSDGLDGWDLGNLLTLYLTHFSTVVIIYYIYIYCIKEMSKCRVGDD